MKTFIEKEAMCEQVFKEEGPFWHLYTDGSAVGDIFACDGLMKIGLTALAVCAVVFKKAELITFELMDNHVHLIMRGYANDCLEFFGMFKRRLRRHLMLAGRAVDWDKFQAQIVGIETLRDLRN